MSSAPVLRVTEIQLFARDTPFRMPFRFGATTVTQAPQAFVRVQVEDVNSGKTRQGIAAELMVPKWFDKSPELSAEDTVQQLQHSLASARHCLLATAPGTVSALYCAMQERPADGAPGLVHGFGPALISKALADAVCHLEQCSFASAIQRNLIGLNADQLPADLKSFDMDGFLSQLQPGPSVHLRHTIGMADPITPNDLTHPVNDGLPETLRDVIQTTGPRFFKIKLSGQLEQDLSRLRQITREILVVPEFQLTLDGNEQFSSPDTVSEFLSALDRDPELAPLRAGLLFIEQPLPRAQTLHTDVSSLAERIPLLIDESDADLDAFPTARRLGYTGVSIKSCKGFIRALINAARVQAWGAPYFLSAEDLTTQAGLGIQQDLALISLLGISHSERNGHHFVRAIPGASEREETELLRAFPHLYRYTESGHPQLNLTDGLINLTDLQTPGFTSLVEPDFSTMRPMAANQL